METRTRRQEDGYIIEVEADKKVALAIQSESGERIYLPGEHGSDTTYYNEDPTFLQKNSGVWTVKHPEEPKRIELIN